MLKSVGILPFTALRPADGIDIHILWFDGQSRFVYKTKVTRYVYDLGVNLFFCGEFEAQKSPSLEERWRATL